MKTTLQNSQKPLGSQRQGGVVLLTTMIALVVITVAALSLARSVDTGTVIAGNLSFKQSSSLVADMGVEKALAWLDANKTAAFQQANQQGYYSTRQVGTAVCDLTGNQTPGNTTDDVDWLNDNSVGGNCGMKGLPFAGTPTGYTGYYVVQRMCNAGTVSFDTGKCESFVSGRTSDGMSKNIIINQVVQPPPAAYYLITVRVDGPRKTVSYVQAAAVIVTPLP